LKDPAIIKHLYRNPIKTDGSVSFEVIKLANDFTYNDLIAIVKKHVDNDWNMFMTPDKLLEKQRNDIEIKKLEYNFLTSVMNNKDYIGIITEKIKEINLSGMHNTSIQENKVSESTINAISSINKNSKPPQGRKIQKNDPNDITKVITVYDSMIYLMRSPENEKLKKVNIIDAIDNDTIYGGYRWNFVDKDDDPNVSNARPTNTTKTEYKADVILQLNDTKTAILAAYSTKISLCNELQITKRKLNKIIDEKLKFNNSYYVFHRDCPDALLKNYTGFVTRTIKTTNAKPIKQINPITKTEWIFNNFDEINNKLGIKAQTIKKAITNNILCGGSIWQYCE
jgi:hypothetical protein